MIPMVTGSPQTSGALAERQKGATSTACYTSHQMKPELMAIAGNQTLQTTKVDPVSTMIKQLAVAVNPYDLG